MPEKDASPLTPEELAELLTDVRHATALRPAEDRKQYEEAQDSVVEARRVAEARAGTFRISSGNPKHHGLRGWVDPERACGSAPGLR